MRLTLAVLFSMCCFCALMAIYAAPPAMADVVDISWPNCRIANRTDFQQAIVGVTGGLDFRRNPCLLIEVQHSASYQLYINTGYPGMAYGLHFRTRPNTCHETDTACLAYNYGYAAAMYALQAADLANVHSSNWWLDVESDNSWTDSPGDNRASLRGSEAALQQHIPLVHIGYYSYPGQWNKITDNWHNLFPAWVATGSKHHSRALQVCTITSFTGGPVVLAQYTLTLDENVTCAQSHSIGGRKQD